MFQHDKTDYNLYKGLNIHSFGEEFWGYFGEREKNE
jgi:hypothetical protein